MLRLPVLLIAIAIDAAHAILTNITVDDTDTRSIAYKGTWEPSASHQSSLDFGGSHTFSSDEGASATFAFSGVAVYYLAPRWPYAVSSRISLDGGIAVLVNLTDPSASSTPAGGSESAPWSIAWFAEGLSQGEHTVVVSMGNYIVVDGFMYTMDDGTSSSSSASSTSASSSSASSSSSSSSSTSSSSSSQSQSQSSSSSQSSSASATFAASSSLPSTLPSHANHGITIGLATALGLATLLAAGILLFAWIRRSRRRRRHSLMPKPYIDEEDGASTHTWPRTRRLFGGGGGGARGVYAPVAVGSGVGHAQESSSSSRSGLISAFPYPYSAGTPPPLAPNRAGSSTNPFTDPWEAHLQSHSQAASGSSSSSTSYAYTGLPAGAMSAAVPRPGLHASPSTSQIMPPTSSTSTSTWAPSSHMTMTMTAPSVVPTSPSAYSNASAGMTPRVGLSRATTSTAASRVVFAPAGGVPRDVDAEGEGEEVRIRRERPRMAMGQTTTTVPAVDPPPYER